MRIRCGGLLLGAVAITGLSACAATAPTARPTPPEPALTAMPTVPPKTPTPEGTPVPLATRPVGTGAKARKGEAIGPIVTYFGAARADGHTVDPQSVDSKGVPTYLSSAGSGFMLVIEAKPGLSGFSPARSVFSHVANDPSQQPDLQIESDRDLGDGSPAVCDKRKPDIGGIPGIKPPSFAPTKRVSDALNDFSCRFETFTESESSCTLTKNGEFSFASKDTTTQFCMIVARAWSFPVGNTLLSVRLRDEEGNPGPVSYMRIHRPDTPAKKSTPAAPKKQ